LAGALVSYLLFAAKLDSRAGTAQMIELPQRTGSSASALQTRQMASSALKSHLHEAGHRWQNVTRLIVIPGGGPGDREHDKGFPKWTKQRTDAALTDWLQHCTVNGQCAILALSAGSMNAPSAEQPDGSIIFESARIMQYLVEAGIPPESIICDFASWDTVGNAWFTRMVVESLLQLITTNSESQTLNQDSALLQVLVYISDFHADRMRAAMEWLFGLQPQVGEAVQFEVVDVPSGEQGVGFAHRLKHEAQGAQMLRNFKHKGLLHSMAEMQTYLLLGGHGGYYKFTHGLYKASTGPGWGNTASENVRQI